MNSSPVESPVRTGPGDAQEGEVTLRRPPGPGGGARSRAVTMEGVSKRYRGGGGIEEVSLEVWPGEVFGFLGPNGAGKTTTIRLLLDLIRPERGELRVLGLDPRRQGRSLRRRLGYLPGDLVLYERLTAKQLLSHFAHLRGGPPWSDIEELAERFGLELDRPIRGLSKGNRQKVGLVQAMMGRPELLVLDEPTAGLDPLVQHEVHELLREAAAEGRSVFLSSHFLSEVDQVADRVGLIRAGRIAAIERIADLRSRSVHKVQVRTVSPMEPATLAGLAGVSRFDGSDHAATFEVTGSLDPLVHELARQEIADLSIREPDLEELFLSFYGAIGDGEQAGPAPGGPSPVRRADAEA